MSLGEPDTDARTLAMSDADDASQSGGEGLREETESALGGAPGYAVKLHVFEGPLDLLLHLIRQNEVEITDIPIAEIATQYLAYLELMRELNLDIAGEYLVMAATLALIKSRMLLPAEADDDDDDGIDPRAELIQRLLEYQRFKEAAGDLSKRRLLGRDVFAAAGTPLEGTPEAEREIEVGLFELIEALRHVIARADEAPSVHEVKTETVTVRERMFSVMRALDGVDSLEFTRIFETEDGPTTRGVIVATFLAVLELTRLTALHIYQGVTDEGAPVGPIRLRKVVDDLPMGWEERITELM